MSCDVCNVEALRLEPGKKLRCFSCGAERVALRRAPDRTLCGTCKTDVTDWYSSVRSHFETLPCGHSGNPSDLICTVKLVEVAP